MSRSLTRGKGYTISPSRLDAFSKGCKRRWAWSAIYGKPPEKATGAQAFGTKAHAFVEDYYINQVIPDTTTPEGRAAVAFIQVGPKAGPQVKSEVAVKYPSIDGFEMPGTIDLVDHETKTIYDLKTTSHLKYAPTADEFRHNGQMRAYACAAMHTFGWSYVHCNWIYVEKSTGNVREVYAKISSGQAGDVAIDVVIREMKSLSDNPPKNPLDVPGNFDVCFSYGRECAFAALCPDRCLDTGKDKTKGDQPMVDKSELIKAALAKKASNASATPATPAPATGSIGSGEGASAAHLAGLLGVGATPLPINPPVQSETLSPLPEVLTAESQPGKRGRRKKVAEAQDAEPIAAPAQASTTGVNTVVEFPQGCELFVDCIPADGRSYELLTRYVASLGATVAAALEVPVWNAAEFAKGNGMLAAALLEQIQTEPLPERLVLNTGTPEGRALRGVLEQICPHITIACR